MAFDEVSRPVLAKEFSAADFNAEEYVKGILKKYDIYRTIREQRNNIQNLGEETAVSLKKNVYRNYRQFIDTAKEISYLEAEMYQLSHLLTEQKSTLAEQIGTDIFERPKGLPVQIDPEVEAYEEKKKNFLDNIKASKQLLNELSVKELFLDGELTEFDPETYSPIQKIGAYLLTDNLLITELPGSGKLSILNMFDLSDLAVVNVRDGQGVKNAFKVLYSLETRMFGAPSKELKLAWLDHIERAKKNYRKGVQQSVQLDAQKLAEMKMKEEETEEETDDDETQNEGGMKSELASPTGGYPNLLNVEWLTELPEDLDMCIAQRDFEGAVKLVEKVRHYLNDFTESPSLVDIRRKIENRVVQLETILEKSLDNSSSSRHVSLRSIRIYVLLLIRLGRSKFSCELFLRNRGFEIKNSFKQLKMEGATKIYINKLASVFFTAIIETGKEYMKNFPLNDNCSAFVVWVHNELQYFTDKFSRQVFTRNCTLTGIAECIRIALGECKRLESIGIDFVFDLQHMLLKDIMSTIFDARDQLLERAKVRALEDSWEECDYADRMGELKMLKEVMGKFGFVNFDAYVKEDHVILSSSTIIFAQTILAFFDECVLLYTAEIHNVFVQCLSEIFKAQSIQFEMILKNATVKGSKIHFILLNAEFVYGGVFEIISSKITKLLGHRSAVLQGVKDEMERLRKVVVSKQEYV